MKTIFKLSILTLVLLVSGITKSYSQIDTVKNDDRDKKSVGISIGYLSNAGNSLLIGIVCKNFINKWGFYFSAQGSSSNPENGNSGFDYSDVATMGTTLDNTSSISYKPYGMSFGTTYNLGKGFTLLTGIGYSTTATTTTFNYTDHWQTLPDDYHSDWLSTYNNNMTIEALIDYDLIKNGNFGLSASTGFNTSLGFIFQIIGSFRY